METPNFEYAVKGPLTRRAYVGLVGSGDLEVLIEPSDKPTAQVRVRTSVDGYAQVCKAVLDRFFARFDRSKGEITCATNCWAKAAFESRSCAWGR